MKLARLISVLIISLIGLSLVQAQDIEFEAFESETFGLTGVVPVGWTNAAPGVYVRGESAADLTSLIIQSAPLPADTLLGALTGQLGIEEFPEPESELETDMGTWTVYLVELTTPVEVNVTVATSEIEGTTYLVLLQSAPDEHEALLDAVFTPVIESLALPVEEEETDLSYTAEDITFESGDLTLAGTLTLPDGDGEYPVVVLVSGSGAQDRDESLPSVSEIKPFRDIAEYLAGQGIATLRYDERGVGESEGDFATADIYDFRDDASAAVDYLAERGGFSHIGVAGHSEGGAFAPEIGLTNDNVDFVIGLAGPTVRIIDISREQNQLLFAANGADEEQLAAIDAGFVAVIAAMEARDDEALRQAVFDLVTAQAGSEPDDETLNTYVAQFETPILQSYVSYDPTPFWTDVDVPTLAIFGSLDLQVSAEQNIPVIEGVNENITIVTIENMNHIFQEAETGVFTEYASLDPVVMPELLETMSEWILEVTSQ